MNNHSPSPRRARPLVALVAGSALLAAGCAAASSAQRPDAAATKGVASSHSAPPGPSTPEPDPTPERRPYTISFGGDVHFEGVLRTRLDSNAKTALGPIASVLKKADLAMVNLETAITTGGDRAPGKQYAFRAPPSALTALKAAGVDVASMANNHGMDFMQSGLADSLAAARKARFPVVGVGEDATEAYRPYRKTVNGNRIAVIGATQVLDSEFIGAWTATSEQGGLASAKDEDRLIRAVRAARKNSDTVIVHLHWGTELEECPNPAQRSLAPKLVAAGADVIVGGHAHILLGGGYLKRAYVNYGMGNFVFYNWGPDTGKTGVLTLTIEGRKVLKDQWTPARIQGGVPVPLSGSARKQAVADWRSLRSCTGLSAEPAS